MRIESLWVKGYRSLRDVRLEGLGAFNVFYGPNGAGKSNILEAIRVLFRLAAPAMLGHTSETEQAKTAIEGGIILRRDLCARDSSGRIVLGAQLTGLADTSTIFKTDQLDLSALSVEVTFDWSTEWQPKLSLSRLCAGAQDVSEFLRVSRPPRASPEQIADDKRRMRVYDSLRSIFVAGKRPRDYGLISAARTMQAEVKTSLPENEDALAWHLSEGRLKSALLAAQIDPRHEVRHRLNALRAFLAGPPLHRPPFAPVQDSRTGEVDLRESLPEPNPEGRDISLDLAGLGIAQIYLILAQAMLLGARAIGIEEPEAHLHAPTSGRHLRQLLVRLVEEKYIDQLFIATHSNLFDLDPTGYFDVSLDEEGCTVVKRADLTLIDQEHLYEPGPAKHALQRMLEYTPGDEVVFRRGDGSPVTATEMLRLLQEDDALAVSFLQDVHGAAVRMVKVQNKKPKSA